MISAPRFAPAAVTPRRGRILFTVGDSYLPQGHGGIQRNTHDLCRCLIERGHEVAVLARLLPGGRLFVANSLKRRLTGRLLAADRALGYPVFRGWELERGLERLLASLQPDRVVLQSERMFAFRRIAERLGTPTVIYQHTASHYDCRDASDLLGARFIANSEFTRDWIGSSYGAESAVVPPLILSERYRVNSTRERVLLMNPHPLKGGYLALALAEQFPEIPFDFVATWYSSPPEEAVKAKALQLPNVTWHAPRDDVRPLLARARLLLMPSQLPETWGRAASEAQVSGIPVLGSEVGGLPEAIGPGGLLVAPSDSLEAWRRAFSALWNDSAMYERLSSAARAHAARPEFSSAAIVDRFTRELRLHPGEAVVEPGPSAVQPAQAKWAA
jgi:glycosyltransferase involved in cell wall biosynthesis